MSLISHILADYGAIPAMIGSCLIKKNMMKLSVLYDALDLSAEEVQNGLSLMIQKRFVKYFKFEKNIVYHLDVGMVKRRLYFPLYLKYVSKKFSEEEAECFLQIMVAGIARETQFPDSPIKRLLEDNVITYDTSGVVRKSDNTKIMRISPAFVMVNYNHLDQLIYEQEMCHYVSKRYNESAGEVYRAILKCGNPNIPGIISNLASTKILVCNNGIVVNEKENVNQYLKYLISGSLIGKANDETNTYFVIPFLENLKIQKLNFLIEEPSLRRILNLIVMKNEISDKDITVQSLVSLLKIKRILFELQSAGLLSQRCQSDYKSGYKMEHYWHVPLKTAILMITNELEKRVEEHLEKINRCWDVDYYLNDANGNDRIWISDVLGMCQDLLIFNLQH